jgi:hypothetical protein
MILRHTIASLLREGLENEFVQQVGSGSEVAGIANGTAGFRRPPL